MNIISFVILHYKDIESTDQCVNSILRMEQQERIRIVVVDNDISELPHKRLNNMQRYQAYDNVNVLSVQENGGFSHANNLGYAHARAEQKASFIIVLNNDVVFTQADFVHRLDQEYSKHPCHVMGPDIVRRSTGEHQNPIDIRLRTEEEAENTVRINRMALKYYSLLYPALYWNDKRMEKRQTQERGRREAYYEVVQENIVPFGACIIFAPEFVRRESMAFWPETRFYYEEYILALRCRRNAYKIIYTSALQVLHESGAATKKDFKSEKLRLKFQMERIAEAAKVYSMMKPDE